MAMITSKNALNRNLFRDEANHGYIKNEIPCFEYFRRIMTHALTLSSGNMYILCFLQFLKHLPFFLGGKSKVIRLYSKFGAQTAWIFSVSVY